MSRPMTDPTRAAPDLCARFPSRCIDECALLGGCRVAKQRRDRLAEIARLEQLERDTDAQIAALRRLMGGDP